MIVKKQFVDAMAELCDITKEEAKEQYDHVMDTLIDVVSKGNEVMIQNFGKFLIKEYQPRQGRNPQTGEAVFIEGHKILKFYPSAYIKDQIREVE